MIPTNGIMPSFQLQPQPVLQQLPLLPVLPQPVLVRAVQPQLRLQLPVVRQQRLHYNVVYLRYGHNL